MKRKLLALLLALALSVFALAACDLVGGGPDDGKDDGTVDDGTTDGGKDDGGKDDGGKGEHEHTFSDKWSSDAENHWHAATCEHGENHGSKAPHADEDEDGLCDVCEYEVGHTHTFVDEWTIDDERHWKEPTCSHTDVKGDEDLHKDDDTNGECDVCGGHVHTLNSAGFCTTCDQQIKPIVETDIGSVIGAATTRGDKVNGGSVEMTYAGTTVTEGTTQSQWHKQDFIIGTNGTYTKRTENEVDGASGLLTGKLMFTENWIPYGTDDNIVGVSAITVDGKYIFAMPASFGANDLLGYYYAVSVFADGYSADQLLYAIYEASQLETASDLEITHDIDANKYEFSFNVFIVNETHQSDDSVVYNVNYYELEIAFTYTDDYVITSLDIVCDCYTSDPGASTGGTYEADIDLDYDPASGTITMRPGAVADTYTFSAVQTVGAREEIELNDGSEFTPSDYEIYEDADFTTPATSLEIEIGNNDVLLYVDAAEEGKFISFFVRDAEVTVTTADGEATRGLQAYLIGSEIQIFPYQAGEYIITFEAIGITKTFNVTVPEAEILGEFRDFSVTVTDNNAWEDLATFTANATGTYTFYLPVNVGLIKLATYNAGGEPEIDPYHPFQYDPNDVHAITVTLYKGQSFKFYVSAPTKGTFIIGYDFTAA